MAKKNDRFYVYVYTDPDTHRPFYIGKGKGYRVRDHLKFGKPKNEKQRKLYELFAEHRNPIVEIVQWDWSATAYLKIGGKEATLMLDKLSEALITIDDVKSMRSLVSDFIRSEFEVKAVDEDKVFSEDRETISYTRAPYHVTPTARVDASILLKAVA